MIILAIPELIRLLTLDGCDFDYALNICHDVFNYTNHTIMPEALEKWDLKLIDSVCPVITRSRLCAENEYGRGKII